MTYEENIEQLKSLIEHFNNGGNDFNATDIEAIQFLLKENQKLKKQLEDAKKAVNTFFSGMSTLETQQQEFINFLGDEINESDIQIIQK